MHAHSPLTLRELLKLPAMQRGAPEVLSGHDALDRPVRWVHAGEVPNIASLLKGRELLLTTGMGINTSARGCRRFIGDLAKRDVAGLAIELGSALREVPSTMLDQARACNLPIIALHREMPFVEVTEAAHQAIVNHQFQLMRRGDELNKRFTELMLHGSGTPEILSALAETIANPVVLEKNGSGIAYHAVHKSSDATVIGAWEAGRHGLPGEVDLISHPVPMGGGKWWGKLTALGLDSPLTDLDMVAVERAVGLIALALRQDREEAVLAMRERGGFLTRILHEEIDDAEASIRIRALGFPARVFPLLAIAVKRASAASRSAAEEGTWALVWRDVRQASGKKGRAMVIGGHADAAVTTALIAQPKDADRDKEATAAAETIEQVVRLRFDSPELPVVAVGRVARSWEEVRVSMREAEETVLSAGHGPRRAWHDALRPDADRLIWSLRNNPALKSFVRTSLDPLLEHDRTHRSQLLPTLRLYCDLAGRKSDVARALFVERQTLYYRLARIESILGIKLTDGDAILGLHLAVRALDYFDRKEN
jgi:purine catabolism regulator